MCAYLQFITIDIFMQNYFARLWILSDDMQKTNVIIEGADSASFLQFPNLKVAKLHAEAPAPPSTMRDDTHDAATPSTRRPSSEPRAPAAGSNKDPTALDRIRYRICKIAEDIIKLEEMLGYLLGGAGRH